MDTQAQGLAPKFQTQKVFQTIEDVDHFMFSEMGMDLRKEAEDKEILLYTNRDDRSGRVTYCSDVGYKAEVWVW